VREAFDSARQIALADEENPYAMATAGLAAFRLNNLSAARQYFTKLSAVDPSSPLAENNLAIVATQQKNYGESLVHYTKAVQIAPGNRLVLDNIEEAIAAYTANGGDKNSMVLRNLMRPFEQAEARMEAEMAKKNLYRYGSTWVPREQLTRLTTTHESIQNAMSQLDARYKTAKQALLSLADQITQANNDYNTTLNSINALNMVINGGAGSGGDVSNSISQRDRMMLDLEAIRGRKNALESQRDQINASFPDMFTQAEKLKAAMNGAEGTQFSGLQRMMELGEDIEPPPPAAVPPPRTVVSLPEIQPPAMPNVPMPDQSEQQVLDNLDAVWNPIGGPVLPSYPRRFPHDNGGRGEHGGHGGHGGHGDHGDHGHGGGDHSGGDHSGNDHGGGDHGGGGDNSGGGNTGGIGGYPGNYPGWNPGGGGYPGGVYPGRGGDNNHGGGGQHQPPPTTRPSPTPTPTPPAPPTNTPLPVPQGGPNNVWNNTPRGGPWTMTPQSPTARPTPPARTPTTQPSSDNNRP
jgi:tetratricopeptide (TPR) repeat protein